MSSESNQKAMDSNLFQIKQFINLKFMDFNFNLFQTPLSSTYSH